MKNLIKEEVLKYLDQKGVGARHTTENHKDAIPIATAPSLNPSYVWINLRLGEESQFSSKYTVIKASHILSYPD